MTTYLDSNLAWELVEYCRSSMRAPERNRVFVALGAGDYHSAILNTITAADRHQLNVPDGLKTRLSAWIDTVPNAAHRGRFAEFFSNAT
jgi:hypothetical protein